MSSAVQRTWPSELAKLFAAFALGLVLAGAVPAHAQSGTAGLELGAEFSQVISTVDGIPIGTKLAPSLFVSTPVEIGVGASAFGLRFEPSYSSRVARQKTDYPIFSGTGPDPVVEDVVVRSAVQAVEFGVLATRGFPVGTWRFAVEAGASPAYLVAQRASVRGLGDYPEEEAFLLEPAPGDEWEGTRRFELSALGGVALSRPLGGGWLGLRLRYRHGVTSIADDVEDDSVFVGDFDIRSVTRSWRLNASYAWVFGGSDAP